MSIPPAENHSRNILEIFARRANIPPSLLPCGEVFVLMVMAFLGCISLSMFNAPMQTAAELTLVLIAILVFSV